MNSKKASRSERINRRQPGYDAGPSDEPETAQNRGGPNAVGNPGAGDSRMSLGELTEAAEVSVRTVRYYIAEGLLPPPERAGPGSSYSCAHLDRLRLIQRLKEAYLPLREIRRRLSGLDDAEVQAILADGQDGGSIATMAPYDHDPSLAGARDYLALLEARARYRTEPLALSIPPPSAPSPAGPVEVEPVAARMPIAQPAHELVGEDMALPQSVAAHDYGHPRQEEQRAHELWRRIPLGDGAELVISDRVYARHRDRIDWLVRWARKVFD
jgi:DNA-binding transcriptional MerR regulator